MGPLGIPTFVFFILNVLLGSALSPISLRLACADFFRSQDSFICELHQKERINTLTASRSLTPLFGNGAGAHGIGRISCVLTKIGKFDITLMYDVSIARLISKIKLTLVSYEKREIKKQV